MSRLFFHGLLTVTLFQLVNQLAPAQTSNGRISGTVTDTSGSVIHGAKVTVTNEATALTWKTTTNSSGFYLITNLPVGGYNVGVETEGFRKARKSGYDLVDAGSITADFK